MSREAIAAAFARNDLPTGERLVAFSLASFAGCDGRAWPSAPVAAARAGLSRSRYLYDRDRLVRRGLVVVEQPASGRGRASTLALSFASTGPWWDGDLNAELFEAVLSRSRARGPARLVLAAWVRLLTSPASCGGFRASSCPGPREWMTTLIAARASSSSSPVSWSCSAARAGAGTPTSGRSVRRALMARQRGEDAGSSA